MCPHEEGQRCRGPLHLFSSYEEDWWNITPPCLLKSIVQGEEILKPVETGAFRHYVPETGPSEHPYFVVRWQVMFQSHALADVLTRP